MNDKRIIYEGYGNNFYGAACEQIFDLDLTNVSRRIRRLSTGLGAARSPIFISDYDALYSSNIVTADRSVLNSCPRGACTRVKQPWAKKICKKSLVLDLYPDFEIIKVNKFGNFVRRLTDTSGYHGDISLSPDKKKMVFTSTRRGDANLWIMNIDGGNLKQITDILGYEGGAKFSLDGKFIVFHASRPKSRTERAHYGLLLNQYHAVELRDTQIFLMNSDGTNISQLTTGNTNLWPQFISSEKILFARNSVAKKKMFNIFLINVDGSGLKQITADDDYTNVYPVTSHDRTKLLWSRNEAESKDMNLFLTDLHPFNSMPDSFNFFFIFELFPTNLLANALSFITDKLFT
ncbi:unnamed protein product [Thelazia callipaeda]|uniref:WD_REPEATS_REGION domain-containing protein n=1 Tax=Thelazia callipaeda TaxID=103827 RepID=A0A0N5CR68_THECL|nr:unnamed protein product [Thelazia callipaeda]